MAENLDLEGVRQMLESERLRLWHRLNDEGGRSKSGNPDRTYLAQSYASRERDTALLALEREQLTQIEQALKRLDAGTYGTRVGCGQRIAAGRLEVLPYATHCIGCQAQPK